MLEKQTKEQLISEKDKNTTVLLAIDEFNKIINEQGFKVSGVDNLKKVLIVKNEVINKKLKVWDEVEEKVKRWETNIKWE